MQPAEPCYRFQFLLQTDRYGLETSWELLTSDGTVMFKGGPYFTPTQDALDECLLDGSFSFRIRDSFGDGICCEYGTGYYVLKMNGVVFKSGGSFGNIDVTDFDVPMLPSAGNSGPVPSSNAPTRAPVGIPDNGIIFVSPKGIKDCFDFEVVMENYKNSHDIQWVVRDSLNNIVGSRAIDLHAITTDTYNPLSSSGNVERSCLLNGSYTFTVGDVHSDGTCCFSDVDGGTEGGGTAHAKLTLRLNGIEFFSAGEFMHELTHTFTISQGSIVGSMSN